MTYTEMATRLDVPYCGGCSITARSHRRGFLFLGVVHFGERRFTRRGAKHFLMLVAKAKRQASPEYINDDRLFGWWYIYHDAVEAQAMASQLGFRIPARLFSADRARCRYLARKSTVPVGSKVLKWVRR